MTVMLRADERDRWRRLLDQARAAGLWYQPEPATDRDALAERAYQVAVESRSQPDTPRVVRIRVTAGGVAVTCTCPAGVAGVPCGHAALAVWVCDAYPFALSGSECPHCQSIFDTADEALDCVRRNHAPIRQTFHARERIAS